MKDRDVASVRSKLLGWYQRNCRDLPWRSSPTPYGVWVSEVMLQQTQVRTVVPYFVRFLKRFPDVVALAAADDDEVIKAWEGLGYYARARNLVRAARVVVAEHRGVVPDDPDTFRALPGVGEYICAAVQSIAFDHPLAVVDGNVKRVLARLFAIEAPINKSSSQRRFRELAQALVDSERAGTFNQAMMELGALVCRPATPKCGECPLHAHCDAKQTNRQSHFPVKERMRPVPRHRVAVGVVRSGERMLITKRPNEGLLGGLWEFPGGKIRDGETPEAAVVREIKEEVGLDVEVTGFVARVQHAYTHFKVDLEVYRCRPVGSAQVVLEGPVDYRWIIRDQIEDFAFPRANHKFIPFLDDGAGDG
jgi:A/G-specific adenine glycosylase